MASFARRDADIELYKPIFIAGVSGIGSVGRIAADLLIEQLHAVRLVRFYSDDLPPTARVDDDCSVAVPSYGLWAARLESRDVMILRGDCQATSLQGQASLAREAFREALKHDPSLTIALGGCYMDDQEAPARLLGAVTDPRMKKRFEAHGIEFVPGTPDQGIAGMPGTLMALCEAYEVDGLCMIAETGGLFDDPLGARSIVEALSGILGVDIDASSLREDDAVQDEEPSAEADPPYFGRASLPREAALPCSALEMVFHYPPVDLGQLS
ncbi:MAG: PAC2 family protein [Candidatus Methanomethylophilaceae archaeon]|nr:PAC2 family protein [Candidatus Methanomethylophilaceae archaeon]